MGLEWLADAGSTAASLPEHPFARGPCAGEGSAFSSAGEVDQFRVRQNHSH